VTLDIYTVTIPISDEFCSFKLSIYQQSQKMYHDSHKNRKQHKLFSALII